MNPIQIIQRYAEARKIISDWAKDGAVIVRPQIAAARARICIQCPLNVKKGIFSRIVASFIRWRISVKRNVSLAIPDSGKLGRCSACFCESDLKVWMPIETIKPDESQRKLYDDDCWLFKMH